MYDEDGRQKSALSEPTGQKNCLSGHEISGISIASTLIFLSLLFCISKTAAQPQVSGATPTLNYLWWEAENFSDSSGTRSESNAALSAERWIYMDEVTAGQPRFLVYDDIEITATGTYHLYARKFYRHGPYRWQFDQQGASTEVSANTTLIDSVSVRPNTVANWTYAGEVELEEGIHSLRIDLLGNKGAAAFDAFVLTQNAFPLRGRYKPDEQVPGIAEPGWFTWNYGVENSNASRIDLTYLNQEVAGQDGYVIADGENFVYQNSGETVRFWGVNAGREVVGMDSLTADRYAADLAKYGVNLVRIHTPLFDGRGKGFEIMDSHEMDRLYYLISALKNQGIYVSLSIYFPLWIQLGPEDERFPGYHGSSPFAAVFFHPELQKIYREWWRRLLTQPNPYTGIALKEEPAVFSLELVNEDSLLFWTLSDSTVPAEAMDILESEFNSWLAQNFGSSESIFKRWGDYWAVLREKLRNLFGRPGENHFNLLPIYDISLGETQRAKDTARFLTEIQTNFFRQQRDYLADEIGFGGMISASNWVTANPRLLGPLDKYSNTTGDFMDRHGYFEPLHQDNGDSTASYSLRVGHRYRDASALLFPSLETGQRRSFSNPVWDIVYDNKPSTISEINWTMPNRYRADMPFLLASFGRLQGTDAIIHFTSTPAPWELELSKFSINSPTIKGQWPAAALAFRRGYVREGEVAAEAQIPLEGHLYDLKGSPLALGSNLDNLRSFAGRTDQDTGVQANPQTFFSGKLVVNFTPAGEYSYIENDSNQNAQLQEIASNTGELIWNYGIGYSTINAPKIQAISGFLAKAGTQQFMDVRITSDMEYGSVWLVSLDDQPLASSGSMLLTIMSEEKNSGWQVTEDNEMRTIVNLGAPPILVRQFGGQIELLREDAEELSVTALDQQGYAASEYGGAERIEFDPETLYYLIQKKPESGIH